LTFKNLGPSSHYQGGMCDREEVEPFSLRGEVRVRTGEEEPERRQSAQDCSCNASQDPARYGFSLCCKESEEGRARGPFLAAAAPPPIRRKARLFVWRWISVPIHITRMEQYYPGLIGVTPALCSPGLPSPLHFSSSTPCRSDDPSGSVSGQGLGEKHATERGGKTYVNKKSKILQRVRYDRFKCNQHGLARMIVRRCSRSTSSARSSRLSQWLWW
jgi:hypothetical protein